MKKTKGAIVKTKNKTQRNQILASQKSVLKNAIKLYGKRIDIIIAFANEDIYFGNGEKDVMSKESEPKFEESIAERTQN